MTDHFRQTPPRLGPWILSSQTPALRLPDYDRAKVTTGIVHLGLGAFHRAHQAVYTDSLLAEDPRWGIAGVSLRASDTRDALEPQGALYTLVEKDAAETRCRVIGGIVETLVAPEDPQRVVEKLAAPSTRIVTLTITEKGYCRNAAGTGLDADRPDISADIADLQRPKTMPGIVIAALSRRRERGLPPFAILSCDNLPSNGKTTRAVLMDFARLAAPELTDWMSATLATPSSMVDRIVPKTTEADRAQLAAKLGYCDAWPVMTEAFSQWVMEDRFPLGRPAWERAGAIFTDAVEPYEKMKLLLLNGSHSALAYLGLLGGFETVAAAFAEPGLKRFVTELAQAELIPTLTAPVGQDPHVYLDHLHQRFANPAIRHALLQIAADGSQKLPQRLLSAAALRLEAGADVSRIAAVIAAWIACWRRASANDPRFDLSDPLSAALLAAAAEPLPAASVLRLAGWDNRRPWNDRFESLVHEALQRIESEGVLRFVKSLRSGP